MQPQAPIPEPLTEPLPRTNPAPTPHPPHLPRTYPSPTPTYPPHRLSRRGRPSAKGFGVGWGQGLESGVAWQGIGVAKDRRRPATTLNNYTAALVAAAARPYSRRARPAA